MKLSDLLEKDVIDERGRRLGQVHDALLVQDGPLLSSGSAALRLHGLVAGRAAVGTRLGYTRGDVGGPAALRSLFRFLQRNAIYIAWSDIAAIEGDRIHVREPEGGFPRVADAAGALRTT
jgi:hypothetical protein